MPEGAKRNAMRGVLVLSFLAGFLSMSQEIVWVALLSFTTGGKPTTFANVLGFLLLGTALGSFLGGRLPAVKENNHLCLLVWGGLSAVPVFLLSLPLSAWLLSWSGVLGSGFIFFMITAVACLWGLTFPLLCAAGIEAGQAVGWRVSWVYLANIIGSVCGPLLTGLLLLDRLTMQTTMVLLAVGVLLFALIVARIDNRPRKGWGRWLVVPVVALLAFIALMDASLIARLQWQEVYSGDRSLTRIVQNRHGIITVEPGQTDILYGGGIYDGQYNVDPVLDSNAIRRAFMLGSLHDQPRRVLMIGLGSGSWARVVADHADVETLDVIEINPGYLDLLDSYPEVASLRDDPKVSITIDDGRRWLRNNPHRSYDVIIMNSTFHWRNYMTYLLSREFFALCKSHLKDGGVFYFNTTFSKDVVHTAADVFSHVTTVGNFAAASDNPFAMSRNQRYHNLLQFTSANGPVLDPQRQETRQVLFELASMPLPDMHMMLQNEPDLMLITDDNMATEYKTERRWFSSDWSWLSFWRRLRTQGSRSSGT